MNSPEGIALIKERYLYLYIYTLSDSPLFRLLLLHCMLEPDDSPTQRERVALVASTLSSTAGRAVSTLDNMYQQIRHFLQDVYQAFSGQGDHAEKEDSTVQTHNQCRREGASEYGRIHIVALMHIVSREVLFLGIFNSE